jgi:hypothetical protein
MVVSCDSSDESPSFDRGKNYFPVEAGLFQLYDVTDIRYTAGVPETLRYELKVVVTDSFPNAEGGYSYVLTRTKRNEGDLEFSPFDTWSARIDDREIVVNEENVPFLKLKLPLAKNDAWDGNSYNSNGEDLYVVEDIRTSFTGGAKTFEDCVIINQNDNQDFVVSLDQRKEIYAKDVGLVYKEVKLLNYCTVGPCLGQQEVESGVVYTQTIKTYGVE